MRVLLLLPALAAACSSTGGGTDSLHFGGGAGPTLVTLDEVRLAGRGSDVRVREDVGSGVQLEVGSAGADLMVLGRLLYARSQHAVPDFAATATVQQFRALALAGPLPLGGPVVALQPLFGLGTGAMQIDPDGNPFLHRLQCGMFDFDLGLELLFGDHVVAGVLGSAGLFGGPGETEGEYSELQFYGGIRF